MINKLQVDNAKAIATLNRLQQGYVPGRQEITEEVNKSFGKHKVGEPYFIPPAIDAHGITDKELYNKAFDNAYKDLKLLFQANALMHDKTIRYAEQFDTEKIALESKLNKALLDMENIEYLLSKSFSIQNSLETFKNLKSIDMSSTAMIDLKQNKVFLNKRNTSKRYDISGSTLDINAITSFEDYNVYGNLYNILSDIYNRHIILHFQTEKESNFLLEVINTLENPAEINTITLDINSICNIDAVLYISDDGSTYREVYSISNHKRLEWCFDNTVIKSFKIRLNKNEVDGYNNNYYEHYFVLENLSIFKNVYENENTLITKPAKLYGAIDSLALDVQELTFPDTNMVYYIGATDVNNKTHWYSIDNHERIDLNILEQKEELINKLDNEYGSEAGNGCYKIYNLIKDTNIKSIELYPGYQMWQYEILENIGGYGYKLNLDSYDSSKVIYKRFLDTEAYNITLKSKQLHILTQYVHVNREETVTIGLSAVNNNLKDKYQQQIYCNGIKCAGTENISVTLKEGLNKIVVLFYLGTNKADYVYETNIISRVNFRSVTDDIYAYPKMKLISLQSLKSDGLEKNYKYFAINGNSVVVKHEPNVPQSDYNNELRYLIRYKYADNKSPYLHYEDKIPFIKVRFKALLLSGNSNYSPQIINYKISGQ